MSLFGMLWPKGASGFGYGSSAEDVTAGLSLQGKTFLVTGCNSGIGLETVRVLGLRGAHVICLARTAQKAAEATAGLQGQFTPIACELSEPASVRAAVADVRALGLKLDGILANAGIMALANLTLQHGYEAQFFTNHVGHFILVTGLLDLLADDGRVVLTSSTGHTMAPKGGVDFNNLDGSQGYVSWVAYGQSKIANLLFAKELARRFAGTQKAAFAVHPGVIATNLTRNMGMLTAPADVLMAISSPLVLKSVGEGAATQVWAATQPGLASISGSYLASCNVAKPRKDTEDPAIAAKLWAKTEEIVAAL
jgi:NAD(P)-dependent dehydrogenase (short-subunit alcohol dehydrogenase family)